jgi:undecaprenyl-diphosphatase
VILLRARGKELWKLIVFWVALAAFTLLSVAAGAGWTLGADTLLLRASQAPASGVLDLFSEAVSLAGGVFLTFGLLAALVSLLYLRGRRTLAIRLTIALGIASLIEVVLKLYLPVPPLPLEYLRSGGQELLITLPNPYPSGHMMRSLFIAGAVMLLWPVRPVWMASALLLAAMAVTRVYLGVHWASDVVGGALLGVAALAWAFRGESRAGAGRTKARPKGRSRMRVR